MVIGSVTGLVATVYHPLGTVQLLLYEEFFVYEMMYSKEYSTYVNCLPYWLTFDSEGGLLHSLSIYIGFMKSLLVQSAASVVEAFMVCHGNNGSTHGQPSRCRQIYLYG